MSLSEYLHLSSIVPSGNQRKFSSCHVGINSPCLGIRVVFILERNWLWSNEVSRRKLTHNNGCSDQKNSCNIAKYAHIRYYNWVKLITIENSVEKSGPTETSALVRDMRVICIYLASTVNKKLEADVDHLGPRINPVYDFFKQIFENSTGETWSQKNCCRTSITCFGDGLMLSVCA